MKLKQFQLYLKQKKIDTVFLIYSEESADINLTYFTQMKPSYGLLAISPKSAKFFITKLDYKPHIQNMTTFFLSKNWQKKIQSKYIKKVGINKESLTINQYDSVKKIFPKCKFVDVSKKLKELRLVKTKNELNFIKKACKVTSDSFNALLKELPKKKLKTEQDVAFFLEKYFRNNNCEVGFPTIAALGKNASTPHHHTSNTKLKRGFLLIDFGARYKNYNADMTRTIFLGTPTKKEKEWYNLLLQSQQAAVDAVKEGISYQELDKISRKVLGKYQKNFTHSLGHGIGLDVHESPQFSDKSAKVSKNIPFTIEPGIYFPSKFGLRIEDTLYLDGKKVKILTTATKKLQIVPKF